MFADYGARVVKVVPPDGDPLIHHGEVLSSHNLGDEQVGSIWAFCNTSKLVVEADSHASEIQRLISASDVVIESSAPDPLTPATLELDRSALVKVYISPFGLSGPWSGRRSNVFTDDAASGHMYLNGEADRHPFRRHGRHTEYAAGMYGFIGALSALIARESTGEGPDGRGFAPRGDGGDASAHDDDVDTCRSHTQTRRQRSAGDVASGRGVRMRRRLHLPRSRDRDEAGAVSPGRRHGASV